jgi:sortase A
VSDAIDEAPPPAAPAPARSGGDWLRFFARGVGQTLITAGVVVLLFVVYEVYITDIFSHAAQSKVHSKLEQEWAKGVNPLLALPGSKSATIPTGTGIANLYIPRLGKDYAFTIVEGTGASSLAKGPGHYVHTALPGQVGDFAIAGHRVGKGEPFLNLDKLRPGDAVIVETETDWYVYRIKGDVATGNLAVSTPDGIPGRQVVLPSDGNVILPVPDHPGAIPTEKLMTLTTCHPKFTATHRMVLHAVLDPTATVPRSGNSKPDSIEALYGKVT